MTSYLIILAPCCMLQVSSNSILLQCHSSYPGGADWVEGLVSEAAEQVFGVEVTIKAVCASDSGLQDEESGTHDEVRRL